MPTWEDMKDRERQIYSDLGVHPTLADLEAEYRWQQESAIYADQDAYYNWRGVCNRVGCDNVTYHYDEFCSHECAYELRTTATGLLYNTRVWNLLQANDDYSDFESYARDDNPGVYCRVVLTLAHQDKQAWAVVEIGEYYGAANRLDTTAEVILTYEDAETALCDLMQPNELVGRSGLTIAL